MDPDGELVELLDIYPDRGLVRVAYRDENDYFTLHKCLNLVDCKQIQTMPGRRVTLLPEEEWVPFKGENNE